MCSVRGASCSAGGDRAVGTDRVLVGDADGSGAMFDAIAHRYDLVNRILSLGLDRRWRARAVRALQLPAGARVLDAATGTADIALEIGRQAPDASIVGIDPSLRMLERGRRKVERAGYGERIELRPGDAQRLPLEDASVDGAAMAFGIRNVPDRHLALREMLRVLRPGARLSILELTDGRGLLARAAGIYVHRLVPALGGLLSGRNEYRYLERSIAEFPTADDFATTIVGCGLELMQVVPLSFGVCHLFVGRRPRESETEKVPTEKTAPSSALLEVTR